MLALRQLFALRLQQMEAGDDFGAGVGRIDHVVNEAALGRDVRIGELFLVRGDDLIDRWDGINLLRTAPLARHRVAYHVRVRGTLARPILDVTVANPATPSTIVRRMRM